MDRDTPWRRHIPCSFGILKLAIGADNYLASGGSCLNGNRLVCAADDGGAPCGNDNSQGQATKAQSSCDIIDFHAGLSLSCDRVIRATLACDGLWSTSPPRMNAAANEYRQI